VGQNGGGQEGEPYPWPPPLTAAPPAELSLTKEEGSLYLKRGRASLTKRRSEEPKMLETWSPRNN
jgi:hypothetical protein